MSQPLVTNGSINSIDPPNAKDINQLDGVVKDSGRQTSKQPQNQANQPNVRHIPIFVEGRDEPLCNKNIDTVDAPVISRPSAPINDIPQPGSIFSRVKDIPVKKIIPPEFHASNVGKATSPARNIPINVVHTQTNSNSQPTQQKPNQAAPQTQPQQQQPQPQQAPPTERRSQSPKPPPQPVDPIKKIQNIQKEILQLMDCVEKFKGGSRKNKEYLYLDEMLTQNLLKLDTIDTEGKENIKAARKEAINCINKCIQVLEAKADKSHSEDKANENSADNKENSAPENPSKENSSEKGISSNSNTIEGNENKPPQNQESST